MSYYIPKEMLVIFRIQLFNSVLGRWILQNIKPYQCTPLFQGDWVEETAELGEVTAHADRVGYEPISSTLWRQREDYCARLIQGAWRRRGQPGFHDGEIFGGAGSKVGSRSVLDAVAEEASEDEDEEDEDESENKGWYY